ncbi:hypothetical protein GTQ34_15780 [Muricauda sp. JGD-17]|uniref:GIY-YIG domain-containing protein n=1 Tax=Flagellimonas ochracea TaxID=2696472 RepID=A0A964WYM9_9FLAO|nr:hypothetical protein [Allomuricauda ochracea]NAY93370.1 hypothetical protein [Allomuricauda ochracea]
MDFNNIGDIKKNGFSGFKSATELWLDKSIIPRVKGVYLVINPAYNKTEFIYPGVGGFFKGRNPNVPVSELKSNYVDNSQVVYIGKAGSPTGNGTLNSRLGQYLRFGKTKNVGHWGGRLIWQLKNNADLIFCWKLTPKENPREVEKRLLHEYLNQFGVRPFANLTG